MARNNSTRGGSNKKSGADDKMQNDRSASTGSTKNGSRRTNSQPVKGSKNAGRGRSNEDDMM